MGPGTAAQVAADSSIGRCFTYGNDLNSACPHPCGSLMDVIGVTSYQCNSETYFLNSIGVGSSQVYDASVFPWTIFQRRIDGSVDFYKTYDEYQQGFGTTKGEFWSGLDALHALTKAGTSKLRIGMCLADCDGADPTDKSDWSSQYLGVDKFALYTNFAIGSEADLFKLAVSGFSVGQNHHNPQDTQQLSDDFVGQNGAYFSTHDKDQDTLTTGNCGKMHMGGWWYTNCQTSNLNGAYGDLSYGKGLTWSSYTTFTKSLQRVEMAVNNGLPWVGTELIPTHTSDSKLCRAAGVVGTHANLQDVLTSTDVKTCTNNISTPFKITNGITLGLEAELVKTTCDYTLRVAAVGRILATAGGSSDSGSDVPQDCDDHWTASAVSGVFTINPLETGEFDVYCDFDRDDGPWTVVQRRFNGDLDFYKEYTDYQQGFGSISGEHWLGLVSFILHFVSYIS